MYDRHPGSRLRSLTPSNLIALVAAALLLALAIGLSAGVNADTAAASKRNAVGKKKLKHLLDDAPYLEIAGGWQITDNELSIEGGFVQFHYVRSAEDARGTTEAEIRWYNAASVEEVGAQLQAGGLVASGTLPVMTTDAAKVKRNEWDTVTSYTTAQVYAVAEGPWLNAVGVWSQDGKTFALSARVESLYMLERLLERPQFLTADEWAIALQPGGAEWLREHFFSDDVNVEAEYVRVQGSDGKVAYEARPQRKATRKSHR
ncbi:MAG TPA: hypothetical protein VFX45_06745 [Solirubrobacterales bacterium]|nr:hypothetical protein [Solirubrobacterales bacterium]